MTAKAPVEAADEIEDVASPEGFVTLLRYLKQQRGFDFNGYKRSSLIRRVQKRMEAVSVAKYSDYVDHLEVHPEEFPLLFNTILINVTAFFRDTNVWEYVESDLVPRILAAKGEDGRIRIWSAGCSSGEEAYTIAMVLSEALGQEAFARRVKVYATDIDDDALAQARQATYSTRSIGGVPQAMLEKYFEAKGNDYAIKKELRRSVIFGRHDLIQDAPISRVDILTCRNTLMYFSAETQANIVKRLNFALNPAGFLVLGKAEMLLTHASLFVPVDLKRRIFSRVPRYDTRGRVLAMSDGAFQQEGVQLTHHVRLREESFDAGPVPQVVVDAAGALVMANERARSLFGLAARDIGRPLQDFELSYRPVELRGRIDEAYRLRRPIEVTEVEGTFAGTGHVFDVHFRPLFEVDGPAAGIQISFVEVTRFKGLQRDLQKSTLELEAAYEEIQSTSEELETTNEELQSTVEELETTNEELQSTNEELETMNEELQSTNEELQTMNHELRSSSGELNRLNGFLGSILASMSAGVVVLDKELAVQVWNDRSEDLWGLRSTEVRAKHFLNLDIGLPFETLKAPIRAAFKGGPLAEPYVIDATNRRGRSFRCKVTFAAISSGEETTGLILLMEEDGSAQTSGRA